MSGGSDGKESTHNAGDPGSIPGLERSPGEGNVNSLQYSCLENSMHREAWWATVHGVAELDMIERFSLSLSNSHVTLGHLCSVVSDSVAPWTVACQGPLSMGLS